MCREEKTRYFANVTTEDAFLPGAGFSKASATLFPKSSLPFALALFRASLIRARYLADGLRDTLHQLSAYDKQSVICGIPLPASAPGRERD